MRPVWCGVGRRKGRLTSVVVEVVWFACHLCLPDYLPGVISWPHNARAHYNIKDCMHCPPNLAPEIARRKLKICSLLSMGAGFRFQVGHLSLSHVAGYM